MLVTIVGIGTSTIIICLGDRQLSMSLLDSKEGVIKRQKAKQISLGIWYPIELDSPANLPNSAINYRSS